MEKDIGKIPKNDQTDIVVRIDDFGGRRGLTIREYVNSDRYTGFTKAGTRISAGEFKKFKEMINSIPEEDMKEIEPQENSESSQNSGSEDQGNDKVPVERPGQSNEELPDY